MFTLILRLKDLNFTISIWLYSKTTIIDNQRDFIKESDFKKVIENIPLKCGIHVFAKINKNKYKKLYFSKIYLQLKNNSLK